MKQPWKNWTGKQRAVFSGILFLVTVSLLTLRAASDRTGVVVAATVLQVLVIPAGLYILVVADKAAKRRSDAGDHSGYAPKVAKRLREREESGTKASPGEIHKAWLLWSLLTAALLWVTFTAIAIISGRDGLTATGILATLGINFAIFVIAGQIAAAIRVRRDRR